MKALKKILISTFGAVGLSCLAFGSVNLIRVDASTEINPYFVRGASVLVGEVVNGETTSGIKYHVSMTMEEFDEYGSIDETTGVGTLDENVQTYTLLMPYYLLGENDLTVDYSADNGATPSISNTSAKWTRNGEYMESVVYLYNIPETDYGTEISVRGYINANGTPVYTKQENGISMSSVAQMEYDQGNTVDKDLLKEQYLDKTVTYHVNGVTNTIETSYNQKVNPTVAEKDSDNDYFVEWRTKSGEKFDFSKPIKNSVEVYAIYQESIVLSDDKPTYNAGAYKRAETDTVVSMTLTLKGNDYVVTGDDYSAIATMYKDHGEAEMTVVYATQNGGSYTLTLPALVVTEDISTVGQFNDLRYFSMSNKYMMQEDTARIRGYFRITSDFNTNTSFTGNNDSAYGVGLTENSGFCATIDGLGHTYTGTNNGSYGLFSFNMYQATLKNWTLEASDYYYHGEWATMLSMYINECTFENVTIKMNRIGDASETGSWTGLVSALGTSATTFNNVTIDFGYGSPNSELYSIFGGNPRGYEAHGQNIYNGLYINSNNATVKYIGVTNGNGVTIEDEINSGANIVFNGQYPHTAEAVTLAEQDLIFDGTTVALNLGDYANEQIVSIKAVDGKYDLGTNSSNLNVSAWLASDKTDWGAQTIVVTTLLDKFTSRTITIPVLVATKVVRTASDLRALDATGYNILATNIECEGESKFATESGKFYGILDGNGKAIKNITVGAGGLFHWMEGATIKNVTFTGVSYLQEQYSTLFASYSFSSTIQGVTVQVESSATLDPTRDYGDFKAYQILTGCLYAFAWSTTVRDVEIDATGVAVYNLLGMTCGGVAFYNVDITVGEFSVVMFRDANQTLNSDTAMTMEELSALQIYADWDITITEA